MPPYDHIVIGVGGMGSAAVYELARRGRRVLGLEQFDIPNTMGSSHGETRIIRLAYFEDPRYVPLLRRAYQRWRDLEHRAGEQLLFITGSLDIGASGGPLVSGSLESCLVHGLAHEVLDASQLGSRFPAFRLPTDHVGVLQPDGGFLTPERCVTAHAAAARSEGAELHTDEQVERWEVSGDLVEVVTDRDRYQARSLVLCAGAWTASLVPELTPYVVPERQVVGWFRVDDPALFAPEHFPVFILEVEEGVFYGFPIHGPSGFKIGRFHHREQRVSPENLDRGTHPEDEETLRAGLRRYLPAADGPLLAAQVCMFTNSPDEHFIIDTLPGMPQVAVAAGFSGHGFKFCSVVGEIMADLAIHGSTPHDIGMFALSRLLIPQVESVPGS